MLDVLVHPPKKSRFNVERGFSQNVWKDATELWSSFLPSEKRHCKDIFMRRMGAAGRCPLYTFTLSSMFLLISMWAGGFFRGFTGPADTVLCNIRFGRGPARSVCIQLGLPPPSGSTIALPSPPFSISSRATRSVCACVCGDDMWDCTLLDIPHVHWRQNSRRGSLHLPSSHQQRTTLQTLIGVRELVRTLFTLRCFRLSIGHIPGRVSGQCSCWRTRSGLQTAVICLTSD